MRPEVVLDSGSVVILLAQEFRQGPLNRVDVHAVMTERTAKWAMFNAMVVINSDGVNMLAKLALCFHRLVLTKPAFRYI